MKKTKPATQSKSSTKPAAAFPGPGTGHDIRKGACVHCHRSGSDLVPACPGYRTAADA